MPNRGVKREKKPMSDTNDAAAATDTEAAQEKTFTQEEVNRIVNARLKEQAEKKFGDYNDLRTQAADAKTLEERLAQVEKRAADAEANALRSTIAATHGLSVEDRDLFLTGSDEATLEAQAKRLTDRVAEKKTHVARKEGTTTTTGSDDSEMREFASQLFDRAD